ncbi:MAG: ligD [Gemmatimonadetes bacterium]|nr:ligD [Gemmatimonadota bacterium]
MPPKDSLTRYRAKRHFDVTSEPAGKRVAKKRVSKRSVAKKHVAKRGATAGSLQFVIQKHAASHLHFDLRLEVGGVMKSWAVPKGPSPDPAVKRLAMEVEDHPMEYNSFEGTIPQGEYGGGTVMLWDRGTYSADDASDGDDESAMREGLDAGKVSITFHGERMLGSWALVRTAREGKPQWLLMKHRDDYAEEGGDLVAEHVTSVESERTMDAIAESRRKWHSNRGKPAKKAAKKAGARSPAKLPPLEPMLATPGTEAPTGKGWIYEPKYDGIRILAVAVDSRVALITRNGLDKSAGFPEITEAVRELHEKLGEPVVLDGEIVALENGEPARFQALQGRMHVADRGSVTRHRSESPAAFYAFDLLVEGSDVLVTEPWRARRDRLTHLFESGPTLRLGDVLGTSSEKAIRLAAANGWEGVIAKQQDAPYRPGERSRAWMKVKLDWREEFVIGGFTEPRNSREHFGALLLGYYDKAGDFVYAGHTGSGFSQKTLSAMAKKLQRLERKTSPFVTKPRTNSPAHWVTPQLIAEIKFSEWTNDGKLRQPIFVGLRDDKEPTDVVYDRDTKQVAKQVAKKVAKQVAKKVAKNVADTPIPLTKLDKVFFPKGKKTKGDMIDYYTFAAPYILPAITDRPLVLKRYPDGIKGEAFYQQKAPDDPPPGVRVEKVADVGLTPARRLIGGNLATLLYLVQLGAISVDPWHSRVDTIGCADYSIIDLDPGPRAPFKRAVQVARWVKEELDELGLHASIKTSGASGIHAYLPLARGTPNDAARMVAELVATRIAEKHPRQATIMRWVKQRPSGSIYVDYLQNIRGKTVATAYSLRARPDATISTPLRWEELTDDLDPREFTLDTIEARLAEVGDLWNPAMKKPNKLKKLVSNG